MTFDLDLKFGEEGEQWLMHLANERTLEVKRDRMWHKTGNVFFEVECNSKPSGINVTTADYFAYILTKDKKQIGVFIWETEHLREALKKAATEGLVKKIKGGDGGRVTGLLVPVEKLGMLMVL